MPSFRAVSKGENFMEKSLKKILIAVLAIICFACIATAVACRTRLGAQSYTDTKKPRNTVCPSSFLAKAGGKFAVKMRAAAIGTASKIRVWDFSAPDWWE